MTMLWMTSVVIRMFLIRFAGRGISVIVCLEFLEPFHPPEALLACKALTLSDLSTFHASLQKNTPKEFHFIILFSSATSTTATMKTNLSLVTKGHILLKI